VWEDVVVVSAVVVVLVVLECVDSVVLVISVRLQKNIFYLFYAIRKD
jgi:hypothetical protein